MARDRVAAILAVGPVRVIGRRLPARELGREAMRRALGRQALVSWPTVVIEPAVEAIEQDAAIVAARAARPSGSYVERSPRTASKLSHSEVTGGEIPTSSPAWARS